MWVGAAPVRCLHKCVGTDAVSGWGSKSSGLVAEQTLVVANLNQPEVARRVFQPPMTEQQLTVFTFSEIPNTQAVA